MKYYSWTIGCQMNFADSRQAGEELSRLGYQRVDRPQDADLILLNTCVVRQSAEDKAVGRLTSLQGLLVWSGKGLQRPLPTPTG